MSPLEAVLLAIVEGLTEFLPVSSTGHMIIVSALLGLENDDFTKVFIVSIQLGAILSVVVFYFQRFLRSLDFYFKLFCAFLPTAVLGLLLKSRIDALLENVTVVALSLLVGGIVLVFVDKWFARNEQALPLSEEDVVIETEGRPALQIAEKAVSYRHAFLIGLFQAVAMVPGVSRSAASIIGGLSQGLNRRTAAEFSFFLAVPTMFAATAKSLYDERALLQSQVSNLHLLLLGNVVAFGVAMLAIRFFINFLAQYGFRAFGYYRIALGLILLGLLAAKIDLKITA